MVLDCVQEHVTVGGMYRRGGFTLVELAVALVSVSALAAVLTFQLVEARTRTQDRTVEQGLVQVSGDAARQASYGDGLLSLEIFSEVLALPTAPEMFLQVIDGSQADPAPGMGPSEVVSDVSVLISDDGSVAFLAARTFSGRCVFASVTSAGSVLVSRPRDVEVCLPRSDFVADSQTVTLLPSWQEGFAPRAAGLPAAVSVGWDAADVVLPEGAPPVSLYVASAQRVSGGSVRSCSVFASDAVAGLQVGSVGVDFACTIADLVPGAEYRITVRAYSDAGVSVPSAPAFAVPLTVEVEGLDGVAGTGEVVIEWGEPGQ